MVFGFAEPSYLAGMIAGAMTHSDRVGVIGGTELPPVRESFRAFAEGVHHVKPQARIVTAYIGNWDDVSAGKEQALAQLANGVDVIFQNADAAGLGVFQAVREASHAYVFGTNSTLRPTLHSAAWPSTCRTRFFSSRARYGIMRSSLASSRWECASKSWICSSTRA